MDGSAGCEKFHVMLIERRKLLRELERLSRVSRESIDESRKAIARVEVYALNAPIRHDGERK